MSKFKVWIAGDQENAIEVETESEEQCPAVTMIAGWEHAAPGMAFLMCYVPCDKPEKTTDLFITIDANGNITRESANEDHWAFWNTTVIPQMEAMKGASK